MKRQRHRVEQRRERGSVVLLAAFGMVALIACAGVALDGGMAYLTRARLSNAVDGAALAAARAAQHGDSDAVRSDNARRAAQAYMRSVYGQSMALVQAHIDVIALAPIHIKVAAEVRQPLFLLPILGYRELPVRAMAEAGNAATPAGAERVPVDLVMVTDMSSSILSTVNAPTRDWDHVIEESQRFFEKLAPQSDRVAQIVYGDGVKLLVPFQTGHRFDVRAMRESNDMMRRRYWDELAGVAGGDTATGPALALANDALARIASRSPSQILLLFTDGVANRACRDVRRPGDPLPVPCVDIGVDQDPSLEGEPVAQMIEGIRTALDRGTKVLIIGYGQELTDPAAAVPGPGRNVRKTGEQWLRDALGDHVNGMFCVADDPASLERCYDSYAEVTLRPGTTGPVRLIR